MSIQMISVNNAKIPTLRGILTERHSDKEKWFNNYILENNPYHDTKASKKLKIGVFLTTLAGVAMAMALTFKAKKMPMKISSLWKINYEDNEVPALVGRLAVGSIAGGLVGGGLLDEKKNFKAKLREAVIQGVGNIATTLGFVWGGMKLFEKIEPNLIKTLKLKGKFAQVPAVLATMACLISGIFTGNKIGNSINKNIFHSNEERSLKLSDLSPHVDDLGLASSFIFPPESVIGKFTTRIIPAALMIAGLSTGLAQENSEKVLNTTIMNSKVKEPQI